MRTATGGAQCRVVSTSAKYPIQTYIVQALFVTEPRRKRTSSCWRTAAGFPREAAWESILRMIRPKAASSRLVPLLYESLRQQILRRDGWRCQYCGTMSNLEVHHREFRSHSGHDPTRTDHTLHHMPRLYASPPRSWTRLMTTTRPLLRRDAGLLCDRDDRRAEQGVAAF